MTSNRNASDLFATRKRESDPQIYKIIKARDLTQAKVGEIRGIKHPHDSTLMRNRAGCSRSSG